MQHECMDAAWMHAQVHRCSTDTVQMHGCSMDALMWMHGCMDAAQMHGCRDARAHLDFREAPAFEMAAQSQEVLTCMPQERLTMRQGAS